MYVNPSSRNDTEITCSLRHRYVRLSEPTHPNRQRQLRETDRQWSVGDVGKLSRRIVGECRNPMLKSMGQLQREV